MIKSVLRSIALSIVLTVSLFAAPISFASTATNITHGPVSQYKFKAAASWKIGTINLSYYNDGSADSFELLYGTKLGSNKGGAVNLPAIGFITNKFTVNHLYSDRYYYFVLIAYKNGQFVYMTEPVMAISN